MVMGTSFKSHRVLHFHSPHCPQELTSSQLAALRGARADNAILNHHIVANKQLSRTWGADQLLPSRLRGSHLRVNKYSSKVAA